MGEGGKQIYTKQTIGRELTPTAKYSVSAIDPKYAAVNGSRGPENRCLAYWMGPMRTAHDARNSAEPTDHLNSRKKVSC